MIKLKVEFSNSFGRDGSQSFYLTDLDKAVKEAVEYVQRCSKFGKLGYVDIYFYDDSKRIPLQAWFIVRGISSGQRYDNGYPIPIETDKVRFVKDPHAAEGYGKYVDEIKAMIGKDLLVEEEDVDE